MIAKLSSFRLETDRLAIRPVIQTDLEPVYAIHSEKQVNQYLPYETWQSWSDALAWYERVEKRRGEEDAEQFVIINKSDGVLLGTCIVFIHGADSESLELGYVLAKPHWGKGYMLEALSEFVPVLAKRLNLTKLMAVIESKNASSLKLISKLGFSELRQSRVDDIDFIYFSRKFDRST